MTVLSWQRALTRAPSPSKPGVVLLHGWAGRSRDWEDNGWAAGLAEAGYEVLAPDLPGHGDSAAVGIPEGTEPGSWTAGVMLADLERLHAKHVAVLGYADLCPLAAHLAVRAPDFVVRTVLIGCDDRGREPLAIEAAAALRERRAGIWDQEVAEFVRRARRDPRHDPRELATWLDALSWPALPRLGDLESPVLLAVGTEDSHREGAPRLAARFGDSRLVTVPGDDRTVLSAPALVAAVLDFLAEAERRPAPVAP